MLAYYRWFLICLGCGLASGAQSCQLDDECAENMYCSAWVLCECRHGYVPAADGQGCEVYHCGNLTGNNTFDKCAALFGPGSSCRPSFLEPGDHICRCARNNHHLNPSNQRCERSTQHTMCVADSNCAPSETCLVNSQCGCALGFARNKTSNLCEPFKCATSGECAHFGYYTFCREGRCECGTSLNPRLLYCPLPFFETSVDLRMLATLMLPLVAGVIFIAFICLFRRRRESILEQLRRNHPINIIDTHRRASDTSPQRPKYDYDPRLDEPPPSYNEITTITTTNIDVTTSTRNDRPTAHTAQAESR